MTLPPSNPSASATNERPSEDLAAMAAHLASLSGLGERYWWHDHRYRLVRSRLPKELPNLLDFGCGNGDFLKYLAVDAPQSRLFGFDESPVARQLLGRSATTVRYLEDWPPPESLSVVTLLDVLEHNVDEAALLAQLHAVMKPGAALILTVPAGKVFWSEWDKLLGHYRRYDRASLTGVLDAAGFEVRELTYFFAYLCPSALWRRLTMKPVASGTQVPEFPHVSPLVNRVLRCFAWLERAWLRSLVLPFGTSLLAVAYRKKDGA